ncbi:unnamed protein product [Paramecium pentaurelia]|uniref:Uncharacterized protein n=1 Tax=Paramecium pentaurelia TaxID=43138 RepID=A0A8S1WMI7_9CILI|nr:unnamed protein product [Paramecium pentaurelia]
MLNLVQRVIVINAKQDDFNSRISCKVRQNRILMNQKCVGLPGFYDPQNEDQISCDISWKIGLVHQIQNVLNVQMKASQAELKLIFLSMCNWICRLSIQVLEMWIKCDPKFQKFFQAAEQTTYQQSLTCIPGQNHVFPENFKSECQVNTEDFRRFYKYFHQLYKVYHYKCGICDVTKATNQCLCIQSYNDDNTDNMESSKCHYSFKTCANSTENKKNACVECPSTRILYQATRWKYDNMFDNGFSKDYQLCDKYCLTCNGPLSSNCLICDLKYRIIDLQSYLCPTGMPLFTITILVINVLIKIQKVVLFVLQNLILEYQKEISANLQMDIIKSMEQCKKCQYKCETCESQAEKCLTFLLNSLCILDSVKGCFCPKEYYNKEDSIDAISNANLDMEQRQLAHL